MATQVSQMTPLPLLPQLPPELWLSILEMVDAREDLLSCSLVSSEMNGLSHRFLWKRYNLPVYFSKRTLGFFVKARALIRRPERARYITHLTLVLKSTYSRSRAQSKYITSELVSQFEQVLSLLTHVTSLTIRVFSKGDYFEIITPPRDNNLALAKCSTPLPPQSVSFRHVMWSLLLKWLGTIPLRELHTTMMPPEDVATVLSMTPSVSDLHVLLPAKPDVSLMLPPSALSCLTRLDTSITMASLIVSAMRPIKVLTLYSQHPDAARSCFARLCSKLNESNAVEIVHTESLPSTGIVFMMTSFGPLCRSLRVISEHHDGSPESPFDICAAVDMRMVARCFQCVPSLTTYVFRYDLYDDFHWQLYQNKSIDRLHAIGMPLLYGELETHFADMPAERGYLRIVFEFGAIGNTGGEESPKWMCWVFTRALDGEWSVQLEKKEMADYTEREKYYFEQPPPPPPREEIPDDEDDDDDDDDDTNYSDEFTISNRGDFSMYEEWENQMYA
ncbi:hypothetical protein DL93DRAFT_2096115 [Clavulina sp. PMI_390]|nr:hypothetical protein DL93DRAFT_2096115 [Clavulina sp. PMI_390]